MGAGGWLDVDYEGDDPLPYVRPTMRGVMGTRGWPRGDDEVAAERLLSALDDFGRGSDNETQRGLAQRTRDALMEIGIKTLAEIVSKVGRLRGLGAGGAYRG